MEREADQQHGESAHLSCANGRRTFCKVCIGAMAAASASMVGFPIVVGGMQVGQTVSFLALVISLALSVALFRGPRASS